MTPQRTPQMSGARPPAKSLCSVDRAGVPAAAPGFSSMLIVRPGDADPGSRNSFLRSPPSFDSSIGTWFPSVVATFLASSLMIIPSDGSGVLSFERLRRGRGSTPVAARSLQGSAGPGGVDNLGDCLARNGGVGLIVEQRLVAGAGDHEVDAVVGQLGQLGLRCEPMGLGVHRCGEHIP